MARSRILTGLLLYPLSRIYAGVMALRNKMFNMGILKQHEFDIPVVVVGNIAVGGTGKTPHTEYLIEALRFNYNVGVLSRGYKRRTRGFVLATRRSRPEDIGDESYQIYQKYGEDITIAVCEDRVKGIRQMREINKDLNLIILDDAFQHRYVKPALSVVLTEFGRPAFVDKMLPLGRLREPMSAINRADMVVVTKCLDQMKPMDFRLFKENLNLFPYQKLFFSKYAYGHLVSVFPESVTYIPALDWLTPNDSILMVTGVANPKPFARHLKGFKAKVKVLRFPDHHAFTQSDMALIQRRFEEMPGQRKFIVTTEKDSVRLANNPYFPHKLKGSIFYLPIKVEFMPQCEEEFDKAVNQQLRNIRLGRPT
ncbi:MAG: tetraacyldisaccharide 4'-kinase [Candidatus Amulumruptor caecigallinarius]|nr:tetraacyldisaccharide 4'-kinase [Candidatus Amulumruptor caecigallinarius]MCM1397695.1 tetraacyldisaccharide 4'-kinase [Candidatus Amulumruptor caecigallinarius]MCM1454711.1 tetraacyldisaccharide 4'-kinase [bacterium]